MRFALLIFAVLSTGCSTFYYPSGKKLAVIGSNVRGLAIQSGGMTVKADVIDNGIIIQKAGAAVSQGIMSATIPAMNGGVIK